MTDIAVHCVQWDTHKDALTAVRRAVFIEEQKVPKALEWDGLDPVCVHFLATADGKPVGTARITPQHQLGRLAVVKAYRGRGIGAMLRDRALEFAREHGFERLFLHAQVDVIGFYEQAGFTAHGGIFIDAGIEHRAMTLKLC